MNIYYYEISNKLAQVKLAWVLPTCIDMQIQKASISRLLAYQFVLIIIIMIVELMAVTLYSLWLLLNNYWNQFNDN